MYGLGKPFNADCSMFNKIQIQRRSVSSHTEGLQDLHPVLQRIYASRGVYSAEDIQHSLTDLVSFTALKGVDAAVELLIDCIVQRKKLLIVGDFDADGATSTALAMLALPLLGLHQVQYLVPNRFKDGYGLTPSIVEQALPLKPDVIMTVDNGIASVEGVACAKQHGIEVIITDHHLPGEQLPEAAAIVNPNQPNCDFPSKALAGVGVVFYLLMALRTALRQRDLFRQLCLQQPNLAMFLDIVALGTVADVVPLDKINRILVHQGLQRIRAGQCRPGIRELIDIAGRQRAQLSAADLGYGLAPRLNAAGRLDDMSLGIECLLAEQDTQARMIAARLDLLNQERKDIEAEMKQSALSYLQQIEVADCNGICLYQPEWHQGVIGILASRIKEQYHRPTIAFAADDAGLLKGSARSIAGFHMRDALDVLSKRHPDLIQKFGGHAMAAGLTLYEQDLPRFTQLFDAIVTEQTEPYQLQHLLMTDGPLQSVEMNLELAQQLRQAGPFGQNFPEPLFDGTFLLHDQRLLGGKHLKLVLAHPDAPNYLLDAIAFNIEPEIVQMLGAEIELVYRLDVNYFRGRESLQLLVEHIQPIH